MPAGCSADDTGGNGSTGVATSDTGAMPTTDTGASGVGSTTTATSTTGETETGQDTTTAADESSEGSTGGEQPVVFEADAMSIDEALLDEANFGPGSDPDRFPLSTAPEDGYTSDYASIVETREQLEAAIASNPPPGSRIIVRDGAMIGGDIVLQGIGGTGMAAHERVHIVPETVHEGLHFLDARFVIHAPYLTLEGFSGQSLGGSDVGFQLRAPGILLNNWRIASISNLGITVNPNSTPGTSAAHYCGVTNSTFGSVSGAPFYAVSVRPSVAENEPAIEQVRGFYIACNRLTGPYGSSNALFTSAGWTPCPAPSWHLFYRNHISDWDLAEDELVSVKTDAWAVVDNLAVNCGSGHWSGRTGHGAVFAGNVTLCQSWTNKPLRNMGHDGTTIWNIHRGYRADGQVASGSRGITITARDPLTGNESDAEIDYYDTSRNLYEYNIMEGVAFWIYANPAFGGDTVPEALPVENVIRNNFILDPLNDPPAFGEVEGWIEEAQFAADNPQASLEENFVLHAGKAEVYTFGQVTTFDFSPRELPWDRDPRNVSGSTLVLRRGPGWSMVTFLRDGEVVAVER